MTDRSTPEERLARLNDPERLKRLLADWRPWRVAHTVDGAFDDWPQVFVTAGAKDKGGAAGVTTDYVHASEMPGETATDICERIVDEHEFFRAFGGVMHTAARIAEQLRALLRGNGDAKAASTALAKWDRVPSRPNA